MCNKVIFLFFPIQSTCVLATLLLLLLSRMKLLRFEKITVLLTQQFTKKIRSNSLLATITRSHELQ